MNGEATRTMTSRMTRHRHRTRAFTWIELLVVIAIIALIISILLPALSKARQSSFSLACQTRLREQLAAVQTYASENEDMLPFAKFSDTDGLCPALNDPNSPAPYIQNALIPYVGGVQTDGVPGDEGFFPGYDFSAVFRCPGVEHDPKVPWLLDTKQNHYRYNVYKCIVCDTRAGREIGSVRRSSVAVLFYDVVWPDWKLEELPHTGTRPFINIGYVDGHVGSMSGQDYFATSPYTGKKESKNPFITEGWD